ncbi:MAG: helix-turn-helix transcriptional regulator [Clostridia bacterium]|nr:helix-turn-helix transcriptional regulator [Clostridia bacterium]
MFGERMKALRLSLGLNQVEFAKTLSVTKQSVSNWENENIQPSIDMLTKIAKLYSVSADYLLGLQDFRSIDVSGLTNEQITHLQLLIDDLRLKSKT